jgi:predicted aspartyl protease
MTVFRSAATLTFVLLLGSCIGISQPGDVAPEPGEVRFELAGPGGVALVVPVRVNGAGPFPFVLDTGATLTCIDETLARELALPDAKGTVALGGGIRGIGPMRLVALDSVALGDATVRDLRGCTVDLTAMRTAGLDVRGLLGLNVLREYRLTVDFARRIVRLDDPSGVGSGPAS